MRIATTYQDFTEAIKQRAGIIEKEYSIDPIDARHIATAEAAHVDFCITCDYTLCRKYQGELKVITPLTFISKYGYDH